MDPFTIGAIANVGGGILGNLLSKDDRDKASGITEDIYNQYKNLSLPDIEKMKLALQNYSSAGSLTPQQEQTVQLGATDALQNVNVDPRLKQTQMNQLSLLEKLSQTGYSPEERAQLDAVQRKVEADNQSRLKQLMEQQQSRGVANSDMALAQRMLESQSAANRQATEATTVQADAFKRALEAMTGAGSLASRMADTDYSQQANLANALNSRELTNTNLQAGTQNRNVDRFNQAQASNLTNQQNIMDKNVNTANAEQQYNKELIQKNYENQLKKLGGQQGAGANLSNTYNQRADSTAGMWSGIGSGVGTIAKGMNKAAPSGAVSKQTMPLNEQQEDTDWVNQALKRRSTT